MTTQKEPAPVNDVIAAIRTRAIMRLDHHQCVMCGYVTSYVIQGDFVSFDAGCHCTGGPSYRPSSFGDIADYLNMQTPETRARIWGEWFPETASAAQGDAP
jgi:hypothetical protein